MSKLVRVVIVEPNKEPYEEEILDTLESEQEVVGGFIHPLYTYKPLVIICNEEGKQKGLPFNRTIEGTYLVGTFYITKHDGEGNNQSLTDEEVAKAKELFALPSLPKRDIGETKEVLMKIYPRMKEYPVNSMTPAISTNDKGELVVSMLVIADDYTIQDFIKDKTGRVELAVSTYIEPNKNGIGKDLAIRIDFYYPTGHPIFETIIYGDSLERQKDFAEALKRVSEFAVWVTDKNYKVKKVMTVGWDYSKAKSVIDQL